MSAPSGEIVSGRDETDVAVDSLMTDEKIFDEPERSGEKSVDRKMPGDVSV
jgi:hypothetical protein